MKILINSKQLSVHEKHDKNQFFLNRIKTVSRMKNELCSLLLR